MIIRSGWGILIPLVYVIPFGICFMFSGIVASKTNNPYAVQLWLALGTLAGLFAVYKLHQYRESQPGQEMIDKATGQEFVYRKSNTFFFMGTKIWLYIFGIISALTVVSGLVTIVTVLMNS